MLPAAAARSATFETQPSTTAHFLTTSPWRRAHKIPSPRNIISYYRPQEPQRLLPPQLPAVRLAMNSTMEHTRWLSRQSEPVISRRCPCCCRRHHFSCGKASPVQLRPCFCEVPRVESVIVVYYCDACQCSGQTARRCGIAAPKDLWSSNAASPCVLTQTHP